VEYKRFFVQAFERTPGKWRAKIWRIDGAPVKVVSAKKLAKFVTRFDETTAIFAMVTAMAAIDGGTFVRDRVASERFWRRRGHANGIRTPPDMRPRSGLSRRAAERRPPLILK
jgi:hypothetical protein